MVEKKVKGRKRHIVTDTQGHLLHVEVHAANKNDGMQGVEVIEKMVEKYPTVEGVCADGGYRGTFEACLHELFAMTVEISMSLPKVWKVLPKR